MLLVFQPCHRLVAKNRAAPSTTIDSSGVRFILFCWRSDSGEAAVVELSNAPRNTRQRQTRPLLPSIVPREAQRLPFLLSSDIAISRHACRPAATCFRRRQRRLSAR